MKPIWGKDLYLQVYFWLCGSPPTAIATTSSALARAKLYGFKSEVGGWRFLHLQASSFLIWSSLLFVFPPTPIFCIESFLLPRFNPPPRLDTQAVAYPRFFGVDEGVRI